MYRSLIAAGVFGVVLAGGLGTVGSRAADQAKSKGPAQHTHPSPEMEKCLKECERCARECEACFVHCTTLVSQGHKDHLTTLRTCLDCGELCSVAAKVMARHGAFMGLTCEACARACELCGAACQKHDHDEQMKRCAEACRDCAKACRDMVKAVGTDVMR